MTRSKEKVAVYGTLRPKNRQGMYVPATHEIVGFIMYDYGAFPYIVDSEDLAHVDSVKVNILEVTHEQLERLDTYEGVDRGLYRRDRVDVFNLETGEQDEAWVYIGANIVPERVLSGDWADV